MRALLHLFVVYSLLILPHTCIARNTRLDSAIAILANHQQNDTLINSTVPADCDVLVLNYCDRRYAFIALNHNYLYTCIWQKNRFVPIDSTITNRDLIRDYRIVDLNGDNLPDVVLSSYWNMHGMATDYIFLGRMGGALKYIPTQQNLFNCTYNCKTRRLTTFYEGGVNSIHSKTQYKWLANKLVWTEKWEYDMYAGILYHYINKAGYQVLLYKKYNAEKDWNRIADSLVWP